MGALGSLCVGMGIGAHPLAACDRGDRLDRRFVLLHASRRLLAETRRRRSGDRRRRPGRCMAAASIEMSKYTLAPPSLPEELIWHKWQSYWTWMSGFALLCWVYYGQSQLFLIDPGGDAARAVAGGGDRDRRAGARLARLRFPLPLAARRQRAAAGGGRLRLRGGDELGLHPGLLRPRRADPHRRADGDDHDRQRVLRHHAEPAEERRGAARRQDARSEMGQDARRRARPTTTTSRCPSCS